MCNVEIVYINALFQIAPNHTPCTLNEANYKSNKHLSYLVCCMSLISINKRQTVRHNNERCSATVCGENTTFCSNMHLPLQTNTKRKSYVLAISWAVPKQSNGGRLPSKAGSFVYLNKSISEHGVTSGFVTTNVSTTPVFSNMLSVYPCVSKDLIYLRQKSIIYSLN